MLNFNWCLLSIWQATAPTNVGSGGNLKAMKGQAEEAKKDSKDAPSTLQVIGDNSAGISSFVYYFTIVCTCG